MWAVLTVGFTVMGPDVGQQMQAMAASLLDTPTHEEIIESWVGSKRLRAGDMSWSRRPSAAGMLFVGVAEALEFLDARLPRVDQFLRLLMWEMSMRGLHCCFLR